LTFIEGDSDVLIPTFTPTMLATFERCPHQFRRRYVEKQKAPQDFSSDLACGNAAHTVLQGIFEVYRRTGGYPINLHERVEAALPSAPYPDRAQWATDVERVLAWVKNALGSIEDAADVALVERWLEYRFPGSADCPAFLLRHRIDLVLDHRNGALEHRDWKTGSRTEVDELQNVAARIVVRTAFPDHERILSSTAFLSHDVVQTDELTRDQVRSGWQRIKRLAAGVATEQGWLPVSNALCPWCPFYQRGCPIYPAPASGPDATTAWLEGAA
jgi:hypothetical protein